jgi:hypothetical protein
MMTLMNRSSKRIAIWRLGDQTKTLATAVAEVALVVVVIVVVVVVVAVVVVIAAIVLY